MGYSIGQALSRDLLSPTIFVFRTMQPSTGPGALLSFFASDIEGSTRLWETQPAAMSAALIRHDALLRGAIEAHGGRVFKTVGDGCFAVFLEGGAIEALRAAFDAQLALRAESWPTNRPIRVRMALHAGPAERRDEDFFGPTINRLARLLSIGHGGQVLLSESAAVLARPSLPPQTDLRDMGRHRLKDLDAAEAVSMLVHAELGDDFPALKSLDALPNNLPRQLNSFVGREEEQRAVAALLETEALVTLTGSGGTGKTRLAVQTAAEALEGFPDGVWLVELASLSDPALVPQAVATAAGVREGAHLPPPRALVEALRNRTSLIVLDNCEHVIGACADLVEELLQASPGLKVLATSREPLNVHGEATFRVPTLSTGDPKVRTAAEALAHDAVRLLVNRARLSDPRFVLTDRLAPAAVQVCRRLDGIPLAIELAASRTKVMSLDGIAARLDDRFRLLTAGSRTALPRQQTLRATIDWSYDLLETTDQTLLRRVSAFAGGWTMEAAEAVLPDEEIEVWDVLDGLMRLVDKSLVIRDDEGEEPRFRLLESVRQYGAEKLDDAEGAAVRERHAGFFAALVDSAEDGLRGSDQAAWLQRLEREHDNIRATLTFCLARPDLIERALGLVGSIGRFWTVRGYLSEGREWIEEVLARASETPSVAQANAWLTAGQLAYWQGDGAAGRRFGENGLRLSRELGDRGGEVRSLFRLGFACLSDGELVRARTCFEEAILLSKEAGEPYGIPHLLNALGEVAYAEGDYAEATRRYREALALFRDFEDDRSVASALKNLASVACRADDFANAHAYLVEGLGIRRSLGNTTGIAVTLDSFGVLAACQGRHARAVFMIAAAHALHEANGKPIRADGGHSHRGNPRLCRSRARARDVRRALGGGPGDAVRGCRRPRSF